MAKDLAAVRGTKDRRLPEGVAALISLRGLRSVAQGALGVVFPLYLLRIGVSTVAVGALFTATAVASAAMTLGVGLLADRWGRKPFVAAFAILTVVGGAVLLLTRDFWLLAPVAVLAGFGRGGLGIGGGQGGPFAPALQSLLAEKSGDERRTALFALASGVGAYASAGGSLLAGMAEWLATPANPLLGYDALFLLTAVAGLAMLAMLWRVRETARPSGPVRRAVLRPSSWRAVGKLSLAGAFNGLGLGFMMGFLPIWFHLRYGVGPAAVGVLLAAVGFLAGPCFWAAASLARRWGEIRTITAFRLSAPLLFAVLPFTASFAASAAVFVVGILLVMAVMPIRQSFAMGVVDSEERASATGIRATAARLPSAFSPVLTGYLLDVEDFALPFWCMAASMAISAVLYYVFFRPQATGPETV